VFDPQKRHEDGSFLFGTSLLLCSEDMLDQSSLCNMEVRWFSRQAMNARTAPMFTRGIGISDVERPVQRRCFHFISQFVHRYDHLTNDTFIGLGGIFSRGPVGPVAFDQERRPVASPYVCWTANLGSLESVSELVHCKSIRYSCPEEHW